MQDKEIKIYYIKKESYENFCITREPEIKDPDIILLGPNILDDINYKNEFENKSFVFKELANISKKHNCIVCAYATTRLEDKTYDSIICCEKGKILGVSDCTMNTKNTQGAELNIYQTDIGKIGIACKCDSNAFECLKLLNVFDAELIINIDVEMCKLKKLCLEYFFERENKSVISLSNDGIFVCSEVMQENKSNFGYILLKKTLNYKSNIKDNKQIYKIISEKL